MADGPETGDEKMAFGKRTWCGFLAVVAAGIAFADGLRLTAPADRATVPTLSEGQKAYLAMPRKERVAYFADEAKRREMKKLGYYPQPLTLSWEGVPAGTKAVVSVYRLPDRTCVFQEETEGTSVRIDNLEIARTYGWRVEAAGESRTAVFTTEAIAPRLIRVPGVPNVRDLGGRIGLGGKRVRQGRVFRSAGLNDNAENVYLTKEELAASGRIPALDAEKGTLEAERARFEAFQKNPASFRLVPNTLSSAWTVFRPAREVTDRETAELARLNAVPESLFGVKGERVTADKRGNFQFERVAEKPVFFLQAFDAEADGYLSVAISSSQIASIRMNGTVVYDLFRIRNRAGDFSSADRTLPLPVKKGRNLMVALVDTNSRARAWRCTIAPSEPVTRLFSSELKYLRYRLKDLYRVYKGRRAGRNRLDGKTLPFMLETLGIKSDIDLRSDGECWGMTGSPLGPTVTWFHYSSSAYGGMQSKEGREAFTKVFRVFLDEKNYPIDFHCIAGQDRTGAVAFILNGLLGVSEEELYLDWESTGFWNGSASFNHRNLFDKLVEGFQKREGADLHAKIEGYVLSLGFTPGDIAAFRKMMLEP